MTLIGIVFVGMWAHLVRHPEHTIDTVTPVQLRRSLRLAYVSPIVYGATIGLAFVSPYICLVVYAMLAVYFARGPSAPRSWPPRSRSRDRMASRRPDSVGRTRARPRSGRRGRLRPDGLDGRELVAEELAVGPCLGSVAPAEPAGGGNGQRAVGAVSGDVTAT